MGIFDKEDKGNVGERIKEETTKEVTEGNENVTESNTDVTEENITEETQEKTEEETKVEEAVEEADKGEFATEEEVEDAFSDDGYVVLNPEDMVKLRDEVGRMCRRHRGKINFKGLKIQAEAGE